MALLTRILRRREFCAATGCDRRRDIEHGRFCSAYCAAQNQAEEDEWWVAIK